MAVLAVRRQSPALIQQGLVAIVIEGASQDFRDSIVALAKLHHSAVKMGIDPQGAFEKAASFAEPGIIKTELKRFAIRAPEGGYFGLLLDRRRRWGELSLQTGSPLVVTA